MRVRGCFTLRPLLDPAIFSGLFFVLTRLFCDPLSLATDCSKRVRRLEEVHAHTPGRRFYDIIELHKEVPF